MQSNYQQAATADQTINELASARALSALCGGSGVGQAPEPPHRVDPTSLHLPVRVVDLHDKLAFERLDSHGLRADTHGYEVGEKTESKQEEKIKKAFRRPVEVKGEKGEWRELGEFKGVLREFKRKPRLALRFAVAAVSYACILIAFVGFGFAYGPVLKAEAGYQWKNSREKICSERTLFIQMVAGATMNCKVGAERQGNSGVKGVEGREVVGGDGGAKGSENGKNAVVFPAPAKTMIKNGSRESVITPGKVAGAAAQVKQLPETAPDEFADAKFVADFSISIPKIDAYAEIFPNVDASNYDEYMPVLQKGVAHARGTALPGMAGNVYLFAHSAGNLMDIARFNAVFYLITKLEKGDAIYVKFGNEKFKYTVLGKKEVDPTDVKFLTGGVGAMRESGGMGEIRENDRVLTLQTCVPPGTDWRRLLVFAKID